MIDYNIEFTKGILFVRLCGVLNRFNQVDIQDSIFEIVKEGGIKFLVFNIEDLEIEEDIELFKNCEMLINENNGKMLLCGNNEFYADSFNFVDDELSALKLFTA